jgi:TonB family protein
VKEDEPRPLASDKPQPGPNGGSSEDRTVAWKNQSNPAHVMDGSVLARINQDLDGLIGEPVDDSKASAVDVILAGDGGTKLVKGSRGGHMSGDGDDRLGETGGIGLGMSGRNGFGTGRGSVAGIMRLGTTGGNGTGVAMRARVTPPKPSDVELGGDAGSRSPESILRVIRQSMGGFRYVYEKYLRDNPNLGGKISLRFTIAPSGDIVDISLVASNTGDEKLDGNLMDQAKRMKFEDIPKGNVTVTYAFLLDKQ